MTFLQTWGALLFSLAAVAVAGRAYLYSKRAAMAETNRRRAAKIAGEHGLPGVAYKLDVAGGLSVVEVKPGESVPRGYDYTHATRNGH